MTALVRHRKGIVSSTNMSFSFTGVRLSIEGTFFWGGGCGTYFIEDNAIQYSTVVIIYDDTLHPGVNEGRSVQVIDMEVILEYGTYVPVVTLVVFVFHAISYICDRISKT